MGLYVPASGLILPAQLDPTDPINRGRVGAWPLIEGRGLVGRDASALKNDATITATGFPWTSDGGGNLALNLSGSSQYAKAPISPAYVAIPGTWACRFDTSSLNGGYPIILSLGGSSGTAGEVSLFIDNVSAKARIQIYTIGSGSITLDITGGPVLTDGVWHILAFIFQSNGVCSLFIDGVSVASGSAGSWGFLPGHPFSIGFSEDGFWKNFVGKIEDVSIWNRMLSAPEAARLANQRFAGYLRAPVFSGRTPSGGGTTVALLSRVRASLRTKSTIVGTTPIAAKVRAQQKIKDALSLTALLNAKVRAAMRTKGAMAGTSALASKVKAAAKIKENLAGTTGLTAKVRGAYRLKTTLSSGLIFLAARMRAQFKAKQTIAGKAAFTAKVRAGMRVRDALNIGLVLMLVRIRAAMKTRSSIAGTTHLTAKVRGGLKARTGLGITGVIHLLVRVWGSLKIRDLLQAGSGPVDVLEIDPSLISFVEPGKTTSIAQPGKTTATAIPGKTTTIVR